MQLKRLRQNLQVEIDAAFLYRHVAEVQKDLNLKQVLFALADIEQRHGLRILEKIHLQDPHYPTPSPSWRVRWQIRLGRWFGYHSVMMMLTHIEQQQWHNNVALKQQYARPLDGTKKQHLQIVSQLHQNPALTLPNGVFPRFERRHNQVDGNALRAAVLGANDGLLSNLSLLMGVVGAASSSKIIILTGIAGLLAGAISMALGEWLSVQSSRELHLHQIQQEKEELEVAPEEEKQELILLYRAKGLSEQEAQQLAEHRFRDKQHALDALVEEELGINQQELAGSAWEAATASFLLFAVGAIIPLFPHFFFSGASGCYGSIMTSVCGLFAIGSATTLFTGKNALWAGIRQILFGLIAAAITYAIGHFMGVSIMG